MERNGKIPTTASCFYEENVQFSMMANLLCHDKLLVVPSCAKIGKLFLLEGTISLHYGIQEVLRVYPVTLTHNSAAIEPWWERLPIGVTFGWRDTRQHVTLVDVRILVSFQTVRGQFIQCLGRRDTRYIITIGKIHGLTVLTCYRWWCQVVVVLVVLVLLGGGGGGGGVMWW